MPVNDTTCWWVNNMRLEFFIFNITFYFTSTFVNYSQPMCYVWTPELSFKMLYLTFSTVNGWETAHLLSEAVTYTSLCPVVFLMWTYISTVNVAFCSVSILTSPTQTTMQLHRLYQQKTVSFSYLFYYREERERGGSMGSRRQQEEKLHEKTWH